MLVSDKIDFIVDWILNYTKKITNQPITLIVGVSGGVDSAITSTLSAKTGLKTIAVSMPIKQNVNQHDLSIQHLNWLKTNFSNVDTQVINLDNIFISFKELMKNYDNELAFANSRSRLRMITLYQIAQYSNGIVVGTGNKIEDFGVGFFTKYGDGGVDISPIGDLFKSEVYELAHKFGIIEEIINAAPTDGLWNDGRTDEDQIGTSYNNLEWAMGYEAENEISDEQRKP